MTERPVFSPVNGGVDDETGDLVLLFGDAHGRNLRLQIPFDQGLVAFEMFKRAASAAAAHARNTIPNSSQRWETNLNAYEAKEVLFGQDEHSAKSFLTLRTVDELQISVLVDREIIEGLGLARSSPKLATKANGPYASVAEDVDHFQRVWCTTFVPPSDVELRWGVAALRRLLVNDLLGKAWRAMGFLGEPTIEAPDIDAMLRQQHLKVEHVGSMIAGGGRVGGIEICGLGMAKTYNPQTGKGPDDEEGFAVSVFNFSRDARGELTASEYDSMVRQPKKLSGFLRSWGAIRRGEPISRKDIIQYFAKWAGGVHSAAERAKGEPPPHPLGLIEELAGKVHALSMDGLDFELLSIGQLLGRSPDVERLKARILESDLVPR